MQTAALRQCCLGGGSSSWDGRGQGTDGIFGPSQRVPSANGGVAEGIRERGAYRKGAGYFRRLNRLMVDRKKWMLRMPRLVVLAGDIEPRHVVLKLDATKERVRAKLRSLFSEKTDGLKDQVQWWVAADMVRPKWHDTSFVMATTPKGRGRCWVVANCPTANAQM